MTNLTRRLALKLMGLSSAWLGLPAMGQIQVNAQPPVGSADNANDAEAKSPDGSTIVSWSDTHDRVFLSGDCWANPMEDWAVVDGAAETSSKGANRNIHLLTHQLTDDRGRLEMSVVLSRLETGKNDTGAGFQLGIRSDINEYRSNVFSNSGVVAGIVDGKLVLGEESVADDRLVDLKNVTLQLSGLPAVNVADKHSLTLEAINTQSEYLARLTTLVDSKRLLGNVALVSNFSKRRLKGRRKKGTGGRYRFNDWSVRGGAFTVTNSNRFGPLLWSMYTLSDSRSDEGFVLKLTALTGPLGEKDNKDVELFVQQDEQWKSLGTAALNEDAWTATFRIANWNEKVATPYKVVYKEKHPSGAETESVWEGNIKANPVGRPLRLGALTCQRDYGFPYAPVADNVIKLDPDMLYFSGDQLYEDHGGYGLIRDPADKAILNYLRKYYMHGMAFRHAMKNAPTVCLPDDHDVFQGNIWGESGAAMASNGNTSSSGGYREPAKMVNVVHKTTVGHHPDYYDPTPVKQNISVYYGDMVYGDVSFAIVADRQFKSGPEHVDTGGGRPDHVTDKDFDTAKLDKPGLILLGERQKKFLKDWAQDWRGHSMKVLLSQTVFAGVATHHGVRNGYLKGDLDAGAWPQTARDNAIDIVRSAMPLHINGDQHLTTLCQYGVEKQRDSFWSFCTPAISAGYPRWWLPDEVGMPHEDRPKHGLPNTGQFTDGFGNLVYVYAVGNPEVGTQKNRYDLAHQKGSGFGMVTIDTAAKTYYIESFRFMIDATDGKKSNQFPGWPVTIQQQENGGENVIE